MHIILALLSGIAGVAWAIYYLDRSGFDFSSLNPFLWKRRAHWKRQYEKPPLYALTNPLEVAGLLTLAIAKETGEISLDEKAQIKALMVSELKRSAKEAEDLFAMSAYMLRDQESIVGEVGRIIENCKARLTPEQVQSIDYLLGTVAQTGGQPNDRQKAVLAEFRAAFQEQATKTTWD